MHLVYCACKCEIMQQCYIANYMINQLASNYASDDNDISSRNDLARGSCKTYTLLLQKFLFSWILWILQ